MKRIAILSNAGGYGGSEKSIELLLPLLAQTYQVDIFVENQEHYQMLLKMREINNVTIIRFHGGKTIVDIGIDIWMFIKYLLRTSPHYIWTNTNKAAFFLSLVPSNLLKRTEKNIFYIRDFQWKYVKYIFFRLGKLGIFLSPTLAYKEYYSQAIFREISCKVIPDPVVIDTYESNVVNENYIVAMGGISRLKGYDLLIQAYVQSSLKQHDIQLFIYGKIVDREFYNELQALIIKNQLEAWVHLCDFTQNVGDIIKKSLFVVNSTVPRFGGPEMLGRTIIEAWAYGKPVIAFNTGGPKYIIDDGQDGLLIAVDDLTSMAKSFDRFIENHQERNKMGLAGRKKVEQEYSLTHVVDQLVELLSEKICAK